MISKTGIHPPDLLVPALLARLMQQIGHASHLDFFTLFTS
jgi:hypothetical protein